MTSKRNSGPPANRVADDVLLDAARSCVLSVGVRRTTLTDVARQADVSRMTVYRRFPDVTSLLAALMTREFGALLGRAAEFAADAPTARSRLVGAALDGARRLIADPLLRSVLDRDASLLLPYLVERIGSTQRLAERFIAEQIRAGHADGSIRTGPIDAQVRLTYLIVQAFVISHRPAGSDVDGAELLTELGRTLSRSLAPDEGDQL